MAKEDKGPFYSYNPAYHSIELHKVCQDCDQLTAKTKQEKTGIWWAEPVCPHEVCPRLAEIKKGAQNNG